METKLAKLKRSVELKEHQVRIEKKLQDRPALLLYHGLGSGKTLSAINAIGDETTDFITPASLRENAKKELKKFTTSNKANVRSYQNYLKKGKQGRYLVLDEAHRIGNSATDTARKLMEDAGLYDKRILLTGSPIRNHPFELGTLARILDPASTIPVSQGAFSDQYVEKTTIKPGFWAGLRGVKPGVSYDIKNSKELSKFFKGKVDYNPIGTEFYPSVTEETVEVPFGLEQTTLYKKMIGDVPYSVRHKVQNDIPLSPSEKVHANAFLNSARQISNTSRSFGGTEISPKLEAAANDIEDIIRRKGKAISYSNFLSSGVEGLSAELTKRKIGHEIFNGKLNDKKRKALIDRYNSDKNKVLYFLVLEVRGLI